PRTGGTRLDGVRALLRGDHGSDISQPHVPACGADRSPVEHLRAQHAADDLGSARRGGRQRPVLFPGRAVSRAMGREVCLERAAAGDADGRRGFRVPCVLVTPVARRRFVAETLFDHTSVLRFIEWRWGLEPLTVRDATAINLAVALDFAAPRSRAPQYAVPPGPFGAPCPSSEANPFVVLRELAAGFGFPV